MVELLIQRNAKAVPVVDETNQVIGIITGGDLLKRGGVDLRLSLQRRLTQEELRDQLAVLWANDKTAADVMTHDPVTIREDTPVDEVGRLMVQHSIKRLPVIDATGHLVGIVSRLDVLRAIASAVRLGAEWPAKAQARPGRPRLAGDIAIRDVPTITPDTPLETVLDQLVSSRFRRVVVTDVEGKVIGLITDAALLAQAAPEAHPGLLQALMSRLPWRWGEVPIPQPGAETAADVMLTDVFCVEQDASLAEVLRTMMKYGVKRLVVVDGEGHLLGLVERQVLLQALLGE